MKRRIPMRILSLFLALALLVPNFQIAFAAETEDPTVPVTVADTQPTETAAIGTEAVETEPVITEPIETEPVETEPVETEPVETEPVETEPVETEPVETEPVETEPVETEPVETEPVETEPVETEPVEETEPTEESEPTEETEPVELPYGLPGLPEGYVLSEEVLAQKQKMIDSGMLSSLPNLTPGVNYKEDQIIVTATSEEDAVIAAEAFGGELLKFSRNYALVQLSDVTVVQAVEAALNLELPLPAASPNYCSQVQPIEANFASSYASSLPEEQSWYSWVKENMTNPDPALLDPRSTNYQWMHDAVDTYAAWGVTTGDPWVKVAVIDTGVYANHPDLQGRVSTINIGLGTSDDDGHGTHVAGIIAASMDNGIGGAGIAPGVSIISIRVSDSSGSMDYWDIYDAIYAAVDAGAHIINMSLGGPSYSWILEDAVNYAISRDVTVIAAMGNVGTNAMEYPAALDGVIAVSATDSSNSRAYFSNYGPWADISAPGQAIYSTHGSGYASLQGTSMAAPVVSGVAALYTSAMGERIDPATMEKALESSATKISGASGMGAGIVNAAKMLDDKPDAPFYVIKYNGKYYDGAEFCKAFKTIPCEASIFFTETPYTFSDVTTGDDRDVIIYTMDGTNPSVKNGEVINGVAIADSEELGFKLAPYAGSTVTIKAARVSGMGMVGKTLTVKLKVGTSSNVTGVTIQGPTQMVAGKSTTFSATVEPAATADQGVTWDIYDASYSMYAAKINSKTGKLTTPKDKTGWIDIIAISNANPNYYAIFSVDVMNIKPVSKITLGYTSHPGYVGYNFLLPISRIVDTNSRSLDPELVGIKWTSSNPKVAEVDQDGRVHCYAKGTVTITCAAMDGSNKKATCKVQVVSAVESITVNGPRTVAKGASATYKAAVFPKDATKNVIWSLSGAPYGVTISSSGKLTVPSYVSNGTSFYVVATSTDYFGVYQQYQVTIAPKCTGIYIGYDINDPDTGYASGPELGAELVRGTAYRVKTVNLFSLDLDHSSGVDNAVQLSCYYSGHNYGVYTEWTSSNPSVATVDSTGYIVAHKAGTAKITCAALDGSNKKATVTIKVANPASDISISTSAPRMMSSVPYIAFGKSVTNKAVFSDTYGKPTNQKVNWRFSVYELDTDGNYVSGSSDYWTSLFQRRNLITLSSSGKLTVKAGVFDYWLYDIAGEFQVNVYATAADGSGASGSISYILTPPTTYMKMDGARYEAYTGDTGWVYFYSDQWIGHDAAFTATSSNPKVVSLYEDDSFPTILRVDYDSSTGIGLYAVYITCPGATGSAKITVKAADGSNKSCSFTVKVY